MANVIERKLLRKAARYWGIQPDYLDFEGEPVKSPSDSIKEILKLISGIDIKDSNDLHLAILKRVHEKIQQVLEPVCLQRPSGIHLSVFLPLALRHEDLQCLFELENGKSEFLPIEVEISNKIYYVGEAGYRKCRIHCSRHVEVGYHQLSLLVEGNLIGKAWLIAPPMSPQPSRNDRQMGVFAPLYAIKSARNLGIGDLGDLKNLQTLLHKQGTDFIGILPILAQNFGKKWEEVSPYSAISKLFWNEVYLDLEEMVAKYPAMGFVYANRDAAQIARLQNTAMTQYSEVVPLKESLLYAFAEIFFENYAEFDKEFIAFKKNKYLLKEYCEFRGEGDIHKIRYHMFVQFQMERQLKNLNHHSKKGFAGVYLDYPVGTSKAGFDSHHFSDEFLNSVSVGAPPDLLFRKGQNWGIAPLHPQKLRTHRYEYFIESLKAHMLVADYIRLDHVMALKRLYVVPAGVNAQEGVYLRYNADEMFAILGIEALRHKVTIIGENLGTVPESIQTSLRENNFKGMWVLPFEAGESPSQAIAKLGANNLACLNTHDMVPFEGFLKGVDIKKFEELGIYTHKKASKEMQQRQETIRRWCQDLDADEPDDLFFEICHQMAKSSAELFLLNIEDLWGETEPQNIPGTWHEYPNWTRKLKFSVEEWSQSAEVNKFINRLAHERKQRKEHGHASDLGRHLSVQ